LSNGLHEIAWGVTDSAGRTAGVGSRFFTVSNGAGVVLDSATGSFRLKAEATGSEATRARSYARSIIGRRGFSLDVPFREYRANRDGVITIQSEELDRIELQVGEVTNAYLLSPDGRHLPLPIGSHVDEATGTFTWQPGAGFVHDYTLIFEREADDVHVRIVLNAKGSGRVGAQIVIDTPTISVAAAFRRTDRILVAGWAADLDSDIDSGVDTVHVWAYPVIDNGTRHGDPIWIGVATYGGMRPDVGAVYGERFTKSGYGIYVSDLPPGTYDLAVFAHSMVMGEFAPARTVRVTIR
jgi:hypothetical protein